MSSKAQTRIQQELAEQKRRSAAKKGAKPAATSAVKSEHQKSMVFLSELGEHAGDDPLLQRLTPQANRPPIHSLNVNQSAGYILDGKYILFTRST